MYIECVASTSDTVLYAVSGSTVSSRIYTFC